MARVLVTGAAGFIGANLIRALRGRGDEVHVIVRKETNLWRLRDVLSTLTVHEIDITDDISVAKAVDHVAPEQVFHLAHYGGNRGETDPGQTRRVIIDGTAALYAACAALPIPPRIVHAGSSSEYGTKATPMREDMVAEPTTEYGLAKLWATLYGEHLRREQGMLITTLRLFSVYGPYESATRLFPAVTLALIKGETPKLSRPDSARDFIYIDDVISAFLRAPAAPAGVFNVGAGINRTTKEAVQHIQNSLDSKDSLEWGEDAGRSFDTTLWIADMTRTHDILGWKAQTPFSEGVQKTTAWLTANTSLYG